MFNQVYSAGNLRRKHFPDAAPLSSFVTYHEYGPELVGFFGLFPSSGIPETKRASD
jgi:hypothetical protein